MINETAANSDSNERVLLYDFWKIMRGEEKEEVMIGDVKFLIQTILRMNIQKRI